MKWRSEVVARTGPTPAAARSSNWSCHQPKGAALLLLALQLHAAPDLVPQMSRQRDDRRAAPEALGRHALGEGRPLPNSHGSEALRVEASTRLIWTRAKRTGIPECGEFIGRRRLEDRYFRQYRLIAIDDHCEASELDGAQQQAVLLL